VSSTSSVVYLRDGATGQLVQAELHDSILQRHLDDHKNHWNPLIVAQGEQHGHWDWERKWSHFSAQLRYQSFAIECNGQTQGLMIVNTIKRCRIRQQANKHLVYVEYLEAAPWNRREIPKWNRFSGAGTVLIAAAIQLSIDEGNHGRIGLHSLPQADTFYRDKCGMTDLGPDVSYNPHPLRYFEMTEVQAAAFIQEGR
jgi:hypothetical protein